MEQIDIDTVRRVLQPIWNDKTPTASLLRGRLESVLTYATVRGWRSGPTRRCGVGGIQVLLPHAARCTRKFIIRRWTGARRRNSCGSLRKQSHVGAGALECLILTAARPGEALEARLERGR